MNEKADPREALKDYVGKLRRNVDCNDIQFDTPLIERRIITSIQVMDLLLFIEQMRGTPLNIEEITPAAFRDINSISSTFFGVNNEN